MKIAITNPTNWPLVRRGTERFINDLAEYLARRGHEVRIVSGHPGRAEKRRHKGYEVWMRRRLWRPWMARLGLLEFHLFFFTVFQHLLSESYDVVLCCTFMDAYAASLARWLTGTPCVFWVNGLPPPIRYFRSRSLKGAVFRRAIQGADEVVALSAYMQEYLQTHFARSGRRIPVPVAMGRFPLSERRCLEKPVIVCAAALEDRRKGGRVLMRAFARVKEQAPGAVLALACRVPPDLRNELLEQLPEAFHQDVRFLGEGMVEDLPQIFGSAACSVLASRWEPFGMVVIESLATGTPVAATRDGALPEILDDGRVGRLFDPGPATDPEPGNEEGLAEAVLGCIRLSRDAATPHRCRTHAARYSWEAVGPEFEQLLENLARRRKNPG